MSKELIERLESDSYSLPAVNGEWIYRDGNNMPRNSCTEAADAIERQSARIAELERENAELLKLLAECLEPLQFANGESSPVNYWGELEERVESAAKQAKG